MADRSDATPAVPDPRESPAVPARGIALLIQALQSLFETSAVTFVPSAATASDLAVSQAAIPAVPSATMIALRERAFLWMACTDEPLAEESLTVADSGWHLVMSQSRSESGERIGVIAMARRDDEAPCWSSSEITCLQTFASLCGSVAGGEDRDPAPSSQAGLDALVTRIAVKLMSVSTLSMYETFEWMLRVLTEFFEVDVSFLRRTDFDREASILVAEWPPRENIPDPDPLGEVPFGTDPMFDGTRNLKEPFTVRPEFSPDAYQERVKEGSGVGEVSGAIVPLIRADVTVGVLGFVKFGDRPWETAETNALQAVASLMVQLEARVDAEERLRYQSHSDELTGLPNRRALVEELHSRLDAGGNRTTGLLCLDLDRFKALNDFLGHDAGDQFLVTVAERLRNAMGTGDFVARLVGDEFVFLIERPSVELEALAMADRLLEILSGPAEINGHQVSRTASLGIALSTGSSVAVEELLAHADAALHRSKAMGGNQAAMFDTALRASVEQRAETEMELRDAIEHGGLLLYYQPEVDLRTGKLLAVEALVRWNHPQRGVLPAGSFITVAEETGLIADLGRWVLTEACRQMSAWREQFPLLRITIRVNVSPAQLATRNIVQLVKECLVTNDLPGRLLCLEITEHAVVQDVDQTVDVLHELKALGITLAIDDFGTGYSSMSQLKHLPVDALKIDQTFVGGLGIDGGDRAIVDATVRLAKSFGLEVVAEGVETVDLVHELLKLGCFRAQGFLLCKPKPAAELETVLEYGGLHPSTFRRSAPMLKSAAFG
jgi:diguanylate cyclase (GGDEF)-like protein